jgi:hypothetical protein
MDHITYELMIIIPGEEGRDYSPWHAAQATGLKEIKEMV